MYGQYHTQTKMLTPSEENFLNAFMKALYKINPSLHKNFVMHEKSRYLLLGYWDWVYFQMQKI